jgi:uncharacterized C2H2 Zn-finger protein
MQNDDMMKPIRKYFTVETAPRQKNKWLIECPKCGEMWHLDKNSKHSGNVLHLLNHARSHDEKKPMGTRKRAALRALNKAFKSL